MGVSLKNPEKTSMGTVCEVQKYGENFTTFVVCTTTGWTSTQNEGMIIALLFYVFMSNSILKTSFSNYLRLSNVSVFCFACKFKTMKTGINIRGRKDF